MKQLLSKVFNTKTDQEIIAEIHNAFDTAEDRLLCQAKQILDSIEISAKSNIEEKAERLNALGFNNSQSVREAVSLKEKRKENESLVVKTQAEAEVINYYKLTYPFLSPYDSPNVNNSVSIYRKNII